MTKSLFLVHPRKSFKNDLEEMGFDTQDLNEEELIQKYQNSPSVLTSIVDFQREREREQRHG